MYNEKYSKRGFDVASLLKVYAAFATFFLLSIYLYKYFLVEFWYYYGFEWFPNLGSLVIVIFSMIPLVFLLSEKKRFDISSFMIMFFLIQFVVPVAVLVAFGGGSLKVFFVVCLSVVIIWSSSGAAKSILGRRNIFTIGRGQYFNVKTEKFIIRMFLGLILLTVLSLVVVTGGRYLSLDLGSVYDGRREVFELISSNGLAYLMNWTTKCFTMFILVYAVIKRRYWLMCFVFLIQVLLFAITTHKSVLFYPVFVLFSIWALKSPGYVSQRFIVGCVLLVLVCAVLTYLVGNNFISSLFIRRVLFLPAHVTFVYFDFFEKYDHVYFSNSILSSFYSYPYEDRFTLIIGRYMGFGDMSANNGMVSTGFMHIGVAGVVLYSIVYGVMLGVSDVVSGDSPSWVSVGVVFIAYREILISSDLLTGLLTHGALVSFMLLFVVRKFEVMERVK